MDRCISTSGGYGTKFEVTGRHHHLFDPTTGTSAGHYIAVSDVAASTMVADALSTALYVTPPERARRLLAAFPDTVVLATLPDGPVRAADYRIVPERCTLWFLTYLRGDHDHGADRWGAVPLCYAACERGRLFQRIRASGEGLGYA
jgi:hypothetical protein